MTRHSRYRSATCLVLLALACRSADEVEQLGPASQPDVVLVTIDTARADHFSCLGDSPVPTPVVDGLASRGVLFTQAATPVPVTLPAHASLFTGKNPPTHGVRSNGVHRLDEQHVTLAELLRAAGYQTGAFVGAAVLERRYGVDQGFDAYDDDLVELKGASRFYAERPAGDVVAAALDWILGRDERPVFVWVHVFDPHVPYAPPEPELSVHASNPYAGEIAYVDRMLGELLAGFEAARPRSDPIVVVTADHGEGLGDHGESTHGMLLYDSTVRVPLVIKGPGLASGTRVEHATSLIDVVPTLVSLLGLELPAGVEGRDLLGSLNHDEPGPGERTVYLETMYPWIHHGWSASRGLRGDRWKLLFVKTPELYDLSTDPREHHDLATESPERVQSWLAKLRGWYPRDAADREATELPDEQTQKRLAALGYVFTTSKGGRGDPDQAPHPRERLQISEKMSAAKAMFERGERAAAIEIAKRLVEEEPGSATFARELGQMYLYDRRLEKAVRAYGVAVELVPSDTDSWVNMGLALQRLGRSTEAIDAYTRALAVNPRHPAARHNRWSLLLETGQDAVVAREADEATGADPDDPEALWAGLLARRGTDSPEQWIRRLEEAVKHHPSHPALNLELGKAYEAAGQLPSAEHAYRVASAASQDALFKLLRLLVATGRVQEALHVLRSDAGLQYSPEMLYLASEIHYRTGNVTGAIDDLQQVVRLTPERADAWATLGDVYLAAGRPADALECYEKVQSLGVDDERTKSQLTQIRRQLASTR